MNKIVIVGAGAALTVGATLAMSQSAGAATSHKAAVHYTTIASTPTGAPGNGHCGYPVANAVLTLGPSSQVVAKGGSYNFSGTYGCNGHGLANHKIYLTATFRTRTLAGQCTSSKGATGSYVCAVKAKTSGTAQTYTQHAVSNTVSATAQ